MCPVLWHAEGYLKLERDRPREKQTCLLHSHQAAARQFVRVHELAETRHPALDLALLHVEWRQSGGIGVLARQLKGGVMRRGLASARCRREVLQSPAPTPWHRLVLKLPAPARSST